MDLHYQKHEVLYLEKNPWFKNQSQTGTNTIKLMLSIASLV